MSYDIFGDEEVKKTETPTVENEETAETEEVETSDEQELVEDKKEEKKEEKVKEIAKDFPKKDLGVGGAAFIDEFLESATPEQMEMLKRKERTLSGFWNWAYSKIKAEYVKNYGRTNGGMFRSASSLAAEYFSDAVKEGTVVECENYKVKSPSPSTSKTKAKNGKKSTSKNSNETARKVIASVAKMSAEAAKKEMEELTGVSEKTNTDKKSNVSSLLSLFN